MDILNLDDKKAKTNKKRNYINFIKTKKPIIKTNNLTKNDHNEKQNIRANTLSNNLEIKPYMRDTFNLTKNNRINKIINTKQLIQNGNENNIYIDKNYCTNTNIYNIEKQYENINKNSGKIIKKNEENKIYESKVFKYAAQQIFNKIKKGYFSIIKSKFFNKLKSVSPKKNCFPNTYQKKNIKNRMILKTNTQYSTSKKENLRYDISSLNTSNSIKVTNLKFNEYNLINSSNKNDAYSTYYNLNNFDDKDSYSNTFQSYKSYSNRFNGLNKSNFKYPNQIENDVYIKKNNLKYNNLTNKIYLSSKKKNKISFNFNNQLNKDYYSTFTNNNEITVKSPFSSKGHKMIKSVLPNNNIINWNLVIDNNNSFDFIIKSSKYLPIKVKNNKLMQNKKIEIKSTLKTKKKYFKILITKLKNIAFCYHIYNLITIKYSCYKKNFLSNLKKINIKEEKININEFNNNNNNNNKEDNLKI
jgi:hypothetical protein